MRCSSFQRSKDGFTLIEVLLVMLIVGLITAVAVPSMREMFSDVGIESAARDIATTLRYAHERAILDGKRYRMRLDLDADTYWLEAQEKRGKAADRLVAVEDNLIQKKVMPTDVGIERVAATVKRRRKGEEYIEFHPDGTSESGSIYISEKRGRSFLVTVEKLNSRVSVREITDY